MICANARASLSAYLDRELPAGEALAVEDHLAECEACRREAEHLRIVGEHLAELRSESAPASLESRVLGALAGAKLEGARSRKVSTPRRWPALAIAAAAVVVLLAIVFLLPSRDQARARELFAQADGAVRNVASLHMKCEWYRPENRRLSFIEREIWVDRGTARWDEDGGASSVSKNGKILSRKEGTKRIPVDVESVGSKPSLTLLLEGIVDTHGPGVRFERQESVKWVGKTYIAVVVKDTDAQGNRLRTIFMLDPATKLPVHGEQERQVDGRWVTEGLINFEFDKKIDPTVFRVS